MVATWKIEYIDPLWVHRGITDITREMIIAGGKEKYPDFFQDSSG